MSDPVLEQLRTLGVAHEVVPCDPELADTAAFCEAYGYAPEDSANAIVVAGKSEPRTYVCCLVLASTRLDVNGTVRRTLGVRKASFASAEETKDLTGMEIGGVTPFGLADGIPLWIDAAVMRRTQLIVGGGGRDRKILCPPGSLAAIPGAIVVDELAKPQPTG